MNQVNMGDTSRRPSSFRERLSVQPLEEGDIQEILKAMQSAYARAGQEVPSDDVLRKLLPKTITVRELEEIRFALQDASDPQNIVRILARRANQYAQEFQATKAEEWKAPIQKSRLFLGEHGTELAAVLANIVNDLYFQTL